MTVYRPEIERVVRIDQIGWNELTKHHWLLCAENAGDADWRHTKRIAEKFVPMGLDMVYHNDVLQYILYVHRASSSFIEHSYKGRGMLDSWKATIEEDFTEVNDQYLPYVYMRKSAIHLKKKCSAKPHTGEKMSGSSDQQEVRDTKRKRDGLMDAFDTREEDSNAPNVRRKDSSKDTPVDAGIVNNGTPMTVSVKVNSIVEDKPIGFFYTPCSRTHTLSNNEQK